MNRHDIVATAAAKLAGILPFATASLIAEWIAGTSDVHSAIGRMTQVNQPHYRQEAVKFLTECVTKAPDVRPQSISLALLAAARCEKTHRDEQLVELAWTGPDASAHSVRRTEQAILQVLDSACHQITLVSYAVYKIPHVCDAIVRAAQRGVRIIVVVETPDRLEGENDYSTLKALGDEVASCSTVYYWPQEQRLKAVNGKTGILHVKCAVSDGRWLFLSSANLTEYAFDINMELGILVTGGNLPQIVEKQFQRLISLGILEKT